MKTPGLILILGTAAFTAQAANNCAVNSQPHVLKPLENWNIISDNEANINAGPYFSGPKLTYSLIYDRINADNQVDINPQTGEITINAQSRDDFNLTVTAKNACGEASSTFNVEIDEEE